MVRLIPLPDNSPPNSSDEGVDDAAGDNVPEDADGVPGSNHEGVSPSPPPGSTVEPNFSRKESTGNSMKSPVKGKSGSKRTASYMTEGAKGEGEVKTAKKKKKKKTTSSSSDAAAAFAAVPEDAIAPTVIPTAAVVLDEEESKKSSGGRVFSEEDDIVILEKVIKYRAMTGLEPSSDPGEFFDFVKGCLRAEVSTRQVMDKVRTLLKKFRIMVDKYKKGLEPTFTPHDSKVFDLAAQIWGITETNVENPIDSDFESNHIDATDTVGKDPVALLSPRQSTRKDLTAATLIDTVGKKFVAPGSPRQSAHKEHTAATSTVNKNPIALGSPRQSARKEHKKARNVESGKGANQPRVVAEETKSNAEVVGNKNDRIVDEGDDGKKTGGGDADDFWARFSFLKVGVETMASQGFSNFLKRLLLEKVKDFGGDKGKEWDEKWRALHIEEMELSARKFDLTAQFSKAVLDELKK